MHSDFPRLRAWASLKPDEVAAMVRAIDHFPRLRAWASLKPTTTTSTARRCRTFPTPSGVGLIEALWIGTWRCLRQDFPRLRAWASLKRPLGRCCGRSRGHFPRLRAWASLKPVHDYIGTDGIVIFPTPSGVGLIEALFFHHSPRRVCPISHAFGRGPH